MACAAYFSYHHFEYVRAVVSSRKIKKKGVISSYHSGRCKVQHRGIFKISTDQSHVILGMSLTCTMERNRTRGHAERMHGLGIIWLAPLEACVFIRRRVGAAQLHWITSGNQPPWPELSAKCNPPISYRSLFLPRYVSCISVVVPRSPIPTLNFSSLSPCWPNSNVGCFAYGRHECISRRLNSKYVIGILEPNLGRLLVFGR